MSLYVQWINRIKTEAGLGWLTESQRHVFDQLSSQWLGASFVCLCGSTGSGKTFLSRILNREQDFVYVQQLEDAAPGSKDVIVDGQAYSRMLRNVALAKGLGRVIVVTHKRPADPMPCAWLELTDKDVRQFQHVLVKNKVLDSFVTNLATTNLDEALRQEAIARGN